MTKQLQRKSLTAAAIQKCLLSMFILCCATGLHAQFQPPSTSNVEYTYPPVPPPPPVSSTDYSSNYSILASWAGGPGCWLLTNSWEGGGTTGFAWQATDMGPLGNKFDTGYLILPSTYVDLNVGIIRNGSSVEVDVSYYKTGVGHFLDIYSWAQPVAFGGPGGGCTLMTSKQLSCSAVFTRISMDTHIGYGTAVVWQTPGGINIIAGNNNAFGPIFTLNGTGGHKSPDVAFTHGALPLNIHVASYRAGAGIIEYYAPWPDIIPGGWRATMCGSTPPCSSTCPLPNTIEDVNPVAVAPNHMEMDAPDHYNDMNWAYTYQNGNDIFARIMNFGPCGGAPPSCLGTAATVCFTDGSYILPGLPPINTAVNDVPVIAFDNMGTPNQSFYCAWHTAFNDAIYNPSSNAYIAIQINDDGTMRNPLMPYSFFGASLTPANISPTPTIALSGCNDLSPFLYETFSESNGSNYIRHRRIPWNAGQFRPAHTDKDTKPEISVNPNPFKDDLYLNIPHDMEAENVSVRITDITGKELGSYKESSLGGANGFLGTMARKLIPGNYFITVECTRLKYMKTLQVTKVN